MHSNHPSRAHESGCSSTREGELVVRVGHVGVKCHHCTIVLVFGVEEITFPQPVAETPAIPIQLPIGHAALTGRLGASVHSLIESLYKTVQPVVHAGHIILARLKPVIAVGSTNWNVSEAAHTNLKVAQHWLTIIKALLVLK